MPAKKATKKTSSEVKSNSEDEEVEEDEKDNKNLSLTEVAKEVLEGKWGSVDDRRLRLSKAGYDHNEVQKEIVRLRNQ